MDKSIIGQDIDYETVESYFIGGNCCPLYKSMSCNKENLPRNLEELIVNLLLAKNEDERKGHPSDSTRKNSCQIHFEDQFNLKRCDTAIDWTDVGAEPFKSKYDSLCQPASSRDSVIDSLPSFDYSEKFNEVLGLGATDESLIENVEVSI